MSRGGRFIPDTEPRSWQQKGSEEERQEEDRVTETLNNIRVLSPVEMQAVKKERMRKRGAPYRERVKKEMKAKTKTERSSAVEAEA